MKCTTKGKRKREKKLDCTDAGVDDGYERRFRRSGRKLPGRDDQRKRGGADGRGSLAHFHGRADGIPDAEIHSGQWEDSDRHTGSGGNAGSDSHTITGPDGSAGSDSRTSSDRSAGSDTHAETDFDRGPDGIPDT